MTHCSSKDLPRGVRNERMPRGLQETASADPTHRGSLRMESMLHSFNLLAEKKPFLGSWKQLNASPAGACSAFPPAPRLRIVILLTTMRVFTFLSVSAATVYEVALKCAQCCVLVGLGLIVSVTQQWQAGQIQVWRPEKARTEATFCYLPPSPLYQLT